MIFDNSDFITFLLIIFDVVNAHILYARVMVDHFLINLVVQGSPVNIILTNLVLQLYYQVVYPFDPWLLITHDTANMQVFIVLFFPLAF